MSFKYLDIILNGNTKMDYEALDGFPLSLSFSVDEAEDPSKIAGSRAKRYMTFPGSKVAEAMAEQFQDVSVINPNAPKSMPARIDVNGQTVFSGKAQLEEVTTGAGAYRRRMTGARYALLGNNATWFDDLSALKIVDLPTIETHEIGQTLVLAKANANPDLVLWGYTLIKYKDWTGGTPEARQVKVIDFTPFFFIRPVIIEAFRQVGYKVVSDFLYTDYFKRMIQPVVLHPLSQEVQARLTLLIADLCYSQTIPQLVLTDVKPYGTYHSSSPDCLPGRYSDPGGYFDTAAGVWTCPASGYYIVTVGPHPNILVQFTFTINNVAPVPNFPTTPTSEIYPNSLSDRYFLNEGDEIRPAVVADVSGGYEITSVIFGIKPDFAYEDGTTINAAYLINPEWTAAQMVLGVTQAFGLVWKTDADAGKVYVEPRDPFITTKRYPGVITHDYDGFFLDTDKKDITPKIDLTKDGKVTPGSGKQKALYRWKSDGGDPNASARDEAASRAVFDGVYTFPDGRFEDGTEDANENPFYAKTLTYADTQIMSDDSEVTPQLPLMMDVLVGGTDPITTNAGQFEPRILYFAGRRNGMDGKVLLDAFDDGGGYSFPASFMVNYNDATGLDPCLSFADEATGTGGAISTGLLHQFHLQNLKRREVGKYVTEFVRWNEIDILVLDFRQKLLAFGDNFILSEITAYKPLSTDSTQTELIADAIPEAGDVSKITGSSLTGLIK